MPLFNLDKLYIVTKNKVLIFSYMYSIFLFLPKMG